MKTITSVKRATIIDTGDVLLDFELADGTVEAFSAPAILIVDIVKRLASRPPAAAPGAAGIQGDYEVLYNASQGRVLFRLPGNDGGTLEMQLGPQTAEDIARDLLEAAEKAKAPPPTGRH